LIVTCHGLCPGTNSVIRELVMSLSFNYKVKEIYGSKYGFDSLLGINDAKLLKLNPD
jgi:6-phosphofructokinase 1